MTNNFPTRKVAAGGVGGALVIVLVGILGGFHIHIDAASASAATTLVTFAISWLVPEADTSIPVGASVDVTTTTTVAPTPPKP
jgi:hypothetical protein